MPKLPKIDSEALEIALLRLFVNGPERAVQVCKLLEISQSTLSRLLSKSKNAIVKIGKGPSTIYALKKKIIALPEELIIYKISTTGEVSAFGTLIPVEGGKFFCCFAGTTQFQLFNDLPYFLDPMRAQGFLGKLVPKAFPELQLPDDIRTWKSEHHLKYWVFKGADLPGDLIIGDESLAQYLLMAQENQIEENKCSEIYARLVQEQQQKYIPNSAAAGAQPKFICFREKNARVLVKYSPSIDSDVGRRWADLLMCEEIALKVCDELIFGAAETRIIATDKRVFLESLRLDRVGVLGRRSVFSLQTLDAEFVGELSGWRKVAKALKEQKKISAIDEEYIVALDMYGELIANSDRHLGNLSCFASDDFSSFKLAPVYDMLPMLFAPVDGQIVERKFDPKLFIGSFALWNKAFAVALEFWSRASNHERISADFRKICHSSVIKLKTYGDIIMRMPKL